MAAQFAPRRGAGLAPSFLDISTSSSLGLSSYAQHEERLEEFRAKAYHLTTLTLVVGVFLGSHL